MPKIFLFLLILIPQIFAQVSRAEPVLDPTLPRVLQGKVLSPEETIKYGSYLFKISNCRDCHFEKGGAFLAGGYKIDSPFGTFYGPNITPDKDTGIGRWTDDDFIRALRRGVAPNGRNYYPSFPYSSYSKMSDTDILAIKAYIFSRPAVKKESKKHELKFPFNIREFISAWKLANFRDAVAYSEDNFIKARGPYESIPTRDWEWNRGAYLVEGPLHCAQCHTPRDQIGNFKWKKWMSGSQLGAGEKAASNITSSQKFGLGKWTAQDWETFLLEATSKNGTEVTGKMESVIDQGTSRLTPADLRAVITYLMSLKPVESSESKRDAKKEDIL
jgi:mono/diheme cytochrome c family protein